MEHKKQENDIFEDIKEAVGCDYISDMPFIREKVLNVLDGIDFRLYSIEQINEFIHYLCLNK